MPDQIAKYMSPTYKLSEHKYSAARVQEMKQKMKEEISQALNLYYEFGDAKNHSYQESEKQAILQELTNKYNQMCLNKRIV